jgi:hypothetical protein
MIGESGHAVNGTPYTVTSWNRVTLYAGGDMTTKGGRIPRVSVRTEGRDSGELWFRAFSGNRQSVGRTMGEALDALVADWGDDLEEAAVLIHRFRPDRHFTEAQYRRMEDLLARRTALTAGERAELESLIDAELEGTVARTEGLIVPGQP